MRLLEQYQEILNKGFRKNFPAWDEMSPFDPVRVIAESLAVSLADIEARQTRFSTTVLDALPSLCSFHRKSARAPRSVYQLKPSQTLQSARGISAAEVFRFQSAAGMYQVAPVRGITLFPLHQFKHTSTGSTHRMTFTYRGQCDEIVLQFLPEAGEAASFSELSGVQLHVTTAEGKKTSFTLEHLTLNDQTNRFQQFGELRLIPRDGEPFSIASSEFELQFHFAGPAPKGRFLANSFEGELLQIQNDYELGALLGTAWEQIALPERALAVPEDLTLCYPDEQTLTIGRLQEEILRARHHEPDRWVSGFFYNAAQHALIIPGGLELAREFLSGITLRVGELRLSADRDSLPKDAKPVLGTQSSILEGIEALEMLSSYLARETAGEYLKRFYSTLRIFSEQQSTLLGIYPEDLITLTRNSHPDIRSVELDVNSERGELTFYLMTGEKPEASIARDVANAVTQVLSRTIPTHYRWQLSPFKVTPLAMDAKVVVSSDTAGLPSGVRGAVLSRLETELHERFGATRLPARVTVAGTEISESLVSLAGDSLSHFPDHQLALKRLDFTASVGENRTFQSELRRPAGTFYDVSLQLDLNLDTSARAPKTPSSRRQGAIR